MKSHKLFVFRSWVKLLEVTRKETERPAAGNFMIGYIGDGYKSSRNLLDDRAGPIDFCSKSLSRKAHALSRLVCCGSLWDIVLKTCLHEFMFVRKKLARNNLQELILLPPTSLVQ